MSSTIAPWVICWVAVFQNALFAGQGAGRMLYTSPNTAFVVQRTGESVITVNDVSGSISTLQTSINNARAANPTNVIVIRLLKGATYSVSSAGLTLGYKQCLVAEGATIQAASASVTVPLITIASGATNVSVAGGTLDGNGASINGISAPAAARVNIDKVIAKNCGQDCIILKGNGNSTYDNEMTVTRCDVSGSPAHAGISIQNSTQTIVADNDCHDSAFGIWLSCAWATVANNTCHNNATGIEIAGGNDNVLANNTCNNNGTGIRAGGSNNMITSNSTGGNSTAGINSNGSSNTYVDNLFTAGNATNFTSAGSGNRIVAYKAPLNAPGQDYFYPPLIDDQHSNPIIVNGMDRTDLTISSTTIDSVQSQYDAARSANPNNVIVLHLNGTFTVGPTSLTLSSNTCVLLNGTIQINGSSGASAAVKGGTSLRRISISGGIIDGGGLTGNNGISLSSASMVQIDGMTVRNFGPSNPRSGGSDSIHLSGGSTPYIITRCLVSGSSARGIWLQLNGPKSVISDNEVTDCNQDGVDCDSSTKGCVAKFNYCHDLVRYGVFIEQSASDNLALGNICNNDGRDINLYNNYATFRAPTQHNTVAFNWCYGSNGIRNGSTGTNTTVTSHNFMFNNTVASASILSELEGSENYYSQNYHVGTLTTSGTEAFFNSSRVSTNLFIRDSNSGLSVLVANAATSNNAPVVIGSPSALENDLWALIPTDSGFYQIKNKKSGLVMNVNGASTNSGALVIQYPFGSGKNDQWIPISTGSGLWYLVNRLSGLCLNVPASLAGTQLNQHPYIGAPNQQFALTLEPTTTAPLPFSLGVSPPTQTILAGSNATFSVTVTTNSSLSGPVLFGVTGLPGNSSANFNPPSLTSNGVSTLTVATATNTPVGNYLLTIAGTNGTNSVGTTISLAVNSPFVAGAGTLLWTAASSMDTNWSRALNWTNLTSGGYGPPGISNDVKIFDLGAVVAVSNINNVLDGSFALNSLQYGNSNGNNTTLIGSGRTLTAGSLTVGTEADGTNTQAVFATMTGAGALKMTNTSGNLIVRQGVATASGNSALRASLDLSGLETFTASIGKAQIGALGANARPAGTLFLARSNALTLSGSSPAIEVGGHGGGSGNAGNGSFLYLGQVNFISANGISIGNIKQGGSSMLFNPRFSNPSAVFRAADSVSPVPTWFIADSQSQSGTVNTTATNDFTGGTVNALVNTLTLARSSTGSGNGNPVGALTFSDGVMNIATLRIAYQGSSGSNYSTATVNINDAATLLVTGTAELAHTAGGPGATNTTGTLNINGGTVLANSIFSGGGVANVAANAGTLLITNTTGSTMSGLTALSLSNAQVRFQLNASSSLTNIATTNLVVSGVNSISVDSLANAAGTNRFPLIKYSNLTGSIANFTIGDLPTGLVGSLSNNLPNQTIDLILSPLIVRPPVVTAVTYSATNATLTLSGTNGSPGLTYSVLASSDVSLPLTNWTLEGSDVFDASGNFTFIIDVNPNHPRRFYVLQTP